MLVLGYDFWKNTLAEDRSIVNGVVWINGVDFTVVGVAQQSFTGTQPPMRPAFYVPAVMAGRLTAGSSQSGSRTAGTPLEDRAARTFVVKGRLKAGVSKLDAQAELTRLWQGLQHRYPEENRGGALTVRSELEERIRDEPTTAMVMALQMALVAIVLIIACANVANLMLGRAGARSREIAIRLALGVSRMRLLRQLLTESLLLALIACALGVGLAYVWLRVVHARLEPGDVPIVIAPHLDHRVLMFSVLVAAVSAVFFGLVPALQSLKTPVLPALKHGAPGQARAPRIIGRNALVVAQVALSVVLLVATGMLIGGIRRILLLDPGFRTDHLITMGLDTSVVGYTPVQTYEFYRRLVDRTAALPGVRSVALANWVPLSRGGFIDSVIPEGYELPAGQAHATVFSATVDDNYFATMGTEIVRGRPFTADDRERSRRVAVVNEEFAKTYWPDQDPIGRRIQLSDSGLWLDVVGVARTGKYLFVGETPMRFLYLPFAQHQRSQMTLLVETAHADASTVAGPVRDVVRAIDADQPVFNVRTAASFYEQRAIAVPLRIMRMVGTMGLLGLALALIGLYGVVAYSVARRTREIGIRMAIGASRQDVLKSILGQGLVLSTAGVVLGGVASVAVAPVLTAGLVGLGASNAETYVTVPIALIGLTLVASYFPARRASMVDPTVTLRCE